jgi:GrpB-like predicted nucleotidyltransferase (UPF0157 family)
MFEEEQLTTGPPTPDAVRTDERACLPGGTSGPEVAESIFGPAVDDPIWAQELAARRERIRQAILGYYERFAPRPRAAARRASLLDDDRLALSLRQALERVAVPLGRAASVFEKARGWFVFGHARMDDHARERLGRSGRWMRHQASLGRAVDRFPDLLRALDGRDGGPPLGKVATWVIGRVATDASVGAWIALGRRVTVRELKSEVKQARDAGSAWPLVGSRTDAAGEPAGTVLPTETAALAEVDSAAGMVLPMEAGAAAEADSATRTVLTTETAAATEAGPPGDAGAPAEACQTAATDTAMEIDRSATSAGLPVAVETPTTTDDRFAVRLPVPGAVREAFYETLELHRAVSGGETTVTSFVEALVAEAYAGPAPPDVETVRLRPSSPGAAEVERSLARCTDSWDTLRDRYPAGSPQALAADVLARLEALELEAGRGDAVELDRQIRELIAIEDELERRLGALLCAMSDRGAWRELMFAGVRHYAEQRLGLSRTATERRTRLTRALKRLPRLRQAYEAGWIKMDAALLVVRILGRYPVNEEVEQAWVERGREATIKRLRDEARALGRHEGSAGRLAVPRPMSDRRWYRSLYLRPGDLRARVWGCGSRVVQTGPADVFLRLALPEDLAVGFCGAIESARRRLGSAAAGGPPEGAGRDLDGAPSLRAVRALRARGSGAPAWVGLLALLEDFVETWDDPRAMPRRRADAVYARDGWRCAAPGCTSRVHLESHHIVYLSQGGDPRALRNQLTLCRFHHQRGEHGDAASVRGTAPLGLVWRLGREELARGEVSRGESGRSASGRGPSGRDASGQAKRCYAGTALEDVGVWYRNERRLPADFVPVG